MRLDRRLVSSLLAALLAAPLTACGTDDPVFVPAPAVAIEATAFAPALGVDLASSTKTATGLYYRDLVVGSGAPVVAGQRLTMRYTGWLSNGTQFDATGPTATFAFTLGRGEVIPGWDQGVAGMRVGGRRQLVIPPSLAYGASGVGPIPGNAVLVFTVEVVSAQ